MLDELCRLRDLLAVREGKPTPDLDHSIRQLMAELDRRDGPGGGEALVATLADTIDPWKG